MTTTANFRVRIGDVELGFCYVSPLTSIGGEKEPRYEPVVLRTEFTGASVLWEWRHSVSNGRADRRDVTIEVLDATGERRVAGWRLLRALPVRWSGPALDALEQRVALEEVELEFEDIAWLTEGAT
jgi:phage tail-like protein